MPIRRPRYIKPGDTRCPMLRLLQDCQAAPRDDGIPIEVSYERQFQTLWKAQRLGYVEGPHNLLTTKGLEFIAAQSGESQ